MLKFIVFCIVLYFLFRFGAFIYRTLSWILSVSNGQAYQPKQQQSRKAKVGDVNIDFVPKKEDKKQSFGGGEYVDYEEVK